MTGSISEGRSDGRSMERRALLVLLKKIRPLAAASSKIRVLVKRL
jgi:hypothetical protein